MENYEQKYKEALEKAREELGSGCLDRGTVEYIFPELKESEDEKIRKEITDLVYYCHGKLPCFPIPSVSLEDMIDWLEKQKPSDEALQYLKENHSLSDVSDFQAAMNIAVAKAFDAGKKAQKPIEWSEEDETKLKDAIKCVHHIHTDFDHNRFFVTELSYPLLEIKGWLKSLTPQSHWKPTDYQIALLEELARNIRNNIRPFCSEVTSLEGLTEQLKTL